jgi:hypothetical protein
MAQALVYDRDGHIVEDPNAIVPDGGRISVAPLFMDHLSEQTRRALQQLHDHSARDAQGFEVGHRPGFFTGTIDHKAGDAARAKWLDHLSSAWKQPPPVVEAKSKPAPQRDRESAWKNYVHRTENAWRQA